MFELNIFISGTYRDLKEEREAVSNSIQGRINFKCIRFETQGSSSDTPIEKCKKMAENCNIYLGIYGKKYGSL